MIEMQRSDDAGVVGPLYGSGVRTMSDTTRIVLIATGVVLLVVILTPLLVMSGMMASMMDGGVMGSGVWLMTAFLVLVLLAGAVLLAVGVSRRP